MTRTRLLLAVAALLAGACARPVDVRLEVTVDEPELLPEMKVEVTADGRPARFLRFVDRSGVKARVFAVDAVVRGKKKVIPALVLRALFGCGWRERPLTLDQDWPAEELVAVSRRGEAANYSARLDPFPGSLGSLWVDTRKSGPGVLGLGPIKHEVPGGRATRLEVATCDAPIPVTYDGAPIGEIPAASTGTFAQPTVVVDPTGRRCYQRYSVWYAPEGPGGFGGGGGRSKPELLTGRKLYYSPEFIAYVFEDAPSSVMARQGEAPTYVVLRDAKCR